MFKSAPTDATRLFIVLVEDSHDHSLFWSALWDPQKNEVWRSDHALIAVDAIEVARVARKEFATAPTAITKPL